MTKLFAKGQFFITGTDTGIGKTHICCHWLRQYPNSLGLKPIATGADDQGNEDALALIKASSIKLPYTDVNPICFTPPTSPHIAAAQANTVIDIDYLCQHINQQFIKAQLTLIEAVGGWHAPLTPRHTVADWAKQLQVPVILVVGMKLGCLNHALLTAQAIQHSGLTLAGWIANDVNNPGELLFAQQTFATLQRHINAPCLHHAAYRTIAIKA